MLILGHGFLDRLDIIILLQVVSSIQRAMTEMSYQELKDQLYALPESLDGATNETKAKAYSTKLVSLKNKYRNTEQDTKDFYGKKITAMQQQAKRVELSAGIVALQKLTKEAYVVSKSQNAQENLKKVKQTEEKRERQEKTASKTTKQAGKTEEQAVQTGLEEKRELEALTNSVNELITDRDRLEADNLLLEAEKDEALDAVYERDGRLIEAEEERIRLEEVILNLRNENVRLQSERPAPIGGEPAQPEEVRLLNEAIIGLEEGLIRAKDERRIAMEKNTALEAKLKTNNTKYIALLISSKKKFDHVASVMTDEQKEAYREKFSSPLLTMMSSTPLSQAKTSPPTEKAPLFQARPADSSALITQSHYKKSIRANSVFKGPYSLTLSAGELSITFSFVNAVDAMNRPIYGALFDKRTKRTYQCPTTTINANKDLIPAFGRVTLSVKDMKSGATLKTRAFDYAAGEMSSAEKVFVLDSGDTTIYLRRTEDNRLRLKMALLNVV